MVIQPSHTQHTEQASEVNTSVMQLQRRLAEVQKERDARGLELQATKVHLW